MLCQRQEKRDRNLWSKNSKSVHLDIEFLGIKNKLQAP